MPYRDPETRRTYYRKYMKSYRLRENFKGNHDKRLAHCKAYHKKHYKRKVSGTLGTIRYEARLAGFKSGFERTLAAQLSASKIKWEYETLKVPYILEGTYNPDFILSNGIIIEAKGVLDRESKRKMAAVKQQRPDLDIRFVFMQADKKVPGTKQTHAAWASRLGFKWADGSIPEEWLNE